ncbi:heterokaryon incompatibility protein-domain-containing protein [Xylaria digitata]|nr:heterokaryon incompatibility protein-domain-containing protein [Xylaria digitata]
MAATSSRNDANLRSVLYSPLDHSRLIIRLIEILPSDNDDKQVSCWLKAVELSEDTRFAALSYVWGDAQITENIEVNGINLPVTTNLASALRHFRKRGFPQNNETGKLQFLRVDAICINQDSESISERNHQVAIMKNIYKTASSVLSWLGPPDSEHLDKALRIIHDIAPIIGVTPNTSDVDLNTEMAHAGLNWLVSNLGPVIDKNRGRNTSREWAPLLGNLNGNMYWRRLWILQETVLAKSQWTHWCICGTASATFAELQQFNSFLEYIRSTTLPKSNKYEHQSAERASWNYLWVYEDSIAALGLLPELRKRSGTEPESPFYEACFAGIIRSATLPHDYIYAIIGIFPSRSIQPDYSKPVRDVYLDCFYSDLSININNFDFWLQLSRRGWNINNERNHLPSWLPDISNLKEIATFLDTRVEPKSLLDDSRILPAEILTGDILRAYGVVCGWVELVKKFDFDYTYDYEANCKILYKFCVDYLVEFFDGCDLFKQELKRTPGPMTGKISSKLPLEALIEVLNWRNKNFKVKSPGFLTSLSLELSPEAWSFYYILASGLESTKGEWDDALVRLGIPDHTQLRDFMLRCFIDSDNVSYDEYTEVDWQLFLSLSKFNKLLALAAESILFKTDRGYLGTGPPGIKPGDLVCAIDRSSLPVLLRNDDKSYFKHMGSCYVVGLSDGESTEMVANGELEIQAFKIR